MLGLAVDAPASPDVLAGGDRMVFGAMAAVLVGVALAAAALPSGRPQRVPDRR